MATKTVRLREFMIFRNSTIYYVFDDAQGKIGFWFRFFKQSDDYGRFLRDDSNWRGRKAGTLVEKNTPEELRMINALEQWLEANTDIEMREMFSRALNSENFKEVHELTENSKAAFHVYFTIKVIQARDLEAHKRI